MEAQQASANVSAGERAAATPGRRSRWRWISWPAAAGSTRAADATGTTEATGTSGPGAPGRGPWPGAAWRLDLVMLAVTIVVVAVLGFLVPYVATPALLGALILATCYSLLAMGTNILVGWSGLITFGQAAFFGGGAYCVALMRDWALSPPLKLLIAGVVVAVAGLLVALALARFLHITFAMLTLVVGQLIYLVAFRTSLVGGEGGIAPVPRGSVAGFGLQRDVDFWVYAVAVLGVVGLAYWRLYTSMFALRLMAVRDDEVRGPSLGLSLVALRGAAGAAAAGIAGIGGGLYAEYAGAVSPTLLYFDLSGAAIFMCLLGGSRFLWGPLIGGVLYALGAGYFLQYTDHPDMYIGIAFMFIIVLLPGGLLSIRGRLLSARRRRHDRPQEAT